MGDGSFASPLADASYSSMGDAYDIGLLSSLYSQMTPFNTLMAIICLLVAYDQSMKSAQEIFPESIDELTLATNSHVYLEKGFYRRPAYENTFHGSLPAIHES